MTTEYVQRSYALVRVNDDEKFGFSLKATTLEDGSGKFLLISLVSPGTPAARAGLQIGMICLEINNIPLISATTADAANAIKLTAAGQPLLMRVKVEASKVQPPSVGAALPRLPSMALPVAPVAENPVPVTPANTPVVESAPMSEKPQQPVVPKPRVTQQPTSDQNGASLPRPPSMTTPTSEAAPPAAPKPNSLPVVKTPPPVSTKPRVSIIQPPPAEMPIAAARPSVIIGSTMIDTSNAIVIDNGAWQSKIGFASSAAPMIFPTISGRHKLAGGPMNPLAGATAFYGSTAFNKKGVLKLAYPYERGVVKNWDDMTALWKYAFRDELRTEPKDCPVVITEPIFTSKEQREKMAEIMFERFEVSALFIGLSSLMGMYASGRTNSSLLVDVGDSLTQIIPVGSDCSAAFLAGQKYALAGCDVSERLAQLLSGETGHSFTALDANLREIKEKMGGVAASAKQAEQIIPKEKFTLPDGNVIEVGAERFRCTEVLFDPARVGMTNMKSIQEAVVAAALKCGDEAPTLLQNIIICGGTTMFPGFAERLESEIKALTPQAFGRPLDVKILSERHGKLSAWLGGAAIAKVAGFQNLWISRQEYAEFGSSFVHRKAAPL